jgi:hypothetical protein
MLGIARGDRQVMDHDISSRLTTALIPRTTGFLRQDKAIHS